VFQQLVKLQAKTYNLVRKVIRFMDAFKDAELAEYVLQDLRLMLKPQQKQKQAVRIRESSESDEDWDIDPQNRPCPPAAAVLTPSASRQ